jgi:hypothetical protein
MLSSLQVVFQLPEDVLLAYSDKIRQAIVRTLAM